MRAAMPWLRYCRRAEKFRSFTHMRAYENYTRSSRSSRTGAKVGSNVARSAQRSQQSRLTDLPALLTTATVILVYTGRYSSHHIEESACYMRVCKWGIGDQPAAAAEQHSGRELSCCCYIPGTWYNQYEVYQVSTSTTSCWWGLPGVIHPAVSYDTHLIWVFLMPLLSHKRTTKRRRGVGPLLHTTSNDGVADFPVIPFSYCYWLLLCFYRTTTSRCVCTQHNSQVFCRTLVHPQ